VKSEIHLRNKYYTWSEVKLNGVKYYLKGNVFLDDKLLNPEKLAESINPMICGEDESQENELGKFLKGLNGEFAAVVETESRILSVVDKLRSIPLFYTVEGGDFFLSDTAYFLKNNFNFSKER
jgi:asparagine synthase (glutamine-hydrolysing)